MYVCMCAGLCMCSCAARGEERGREGEGGCNKVYAYVC